MARKTYYYHDLVTDDFAATKIKTEELPPDYKYVNRNPFYLLASGFLRFLAIVVISFMLRVNFLLRIKNRKLIKRAKGKGYFLYGNYTDYLIDAVTPSLVASRISPMLSSIPMPSRSKGLNCW